MLLLGNYSFQKQWPPDIWVDHAFPRTVTLITEWKTFISYTFQQENDPKHNANTPVV